MSCLCNAPPQQPTPNSLSGAHRRLACVEISVFVAVAGVNVRYKPMCSVLPEKQEEEEACFLDRLDDKFLLLRSLSLARQTLSMSDCVHAISSPTANRALEKPARERNPGPFTAALRAPSQK